MPKLGPYHWAPDSQGATLDATRARPPALPKGAELLTLATAGTTPWFAATDRDDGVRYARAGEAWSAPLGAARDGDPRHRCATAAATWIAVGSSVVAITADGPARIAERTAGPLICGGEHAALIGAAEIVRCTARECAPPIYAGVLAAALADDGRLVVAREDVPGVAIEVYEGTRPRRLAVVQPPGAARFWLGVQGGDITALVGNDDGAVWIARTALQ